MKNFHQFLPSPTVQITSTNTSNISHPISVNGSYDKTIGSADITRVILSGTLEGPYTYELYDFYGEKDRGNNKSNSYL